MELQTDGKKVTHSSLKGKSKGFNNTLRAGVRYIHTFNQKTAVVSCLANATAPPPIALESCSNP